MERITSSDPMELDMIDTDAGDAPTVDCAIRVAFSGGSIYYLERLGQDELIASVALVRQATSDHVKRLEGHDSMIQLPPGAKSLKAYDLMDECIRKLQQEVGPHLPLGDGHSVHQKPFSVFEEEPLTRTTSIVQKPNPFVHLERPMLRPALARLAGMDNEQNSYIHALCLFPLLESICRNLTAEGLMGLALSCTQIASTLKLHDAASLQR